MIQTVSVMDKDDPPRGHKFFFEPVPEFPLNPNFTIVDNKGTEHFCEQNVMRPEDATSQTDPTYFLSTFFSPPQITQQESWLEKMGTAATKWAPTYSPF